MKSDPWRPPRRGLLKLFKSGNNPNINKNKHRNNLCLRMNRSCPCVPGRKHVIYKDQKYITPTGLSVPKRDTQTASEACAALPSCDVSTARSNSVRTWTCKREAQEAYFRGRYYWNTRKTKEGLEKAVSLFQQAIARAPDYAQAYSGLADSYVLLGSRSFLPPKDAFPRAKSEALKALSLDNTLAEAHAAPAFAGLYYDWDWTEAEREFRRAIELNPSYTNAQHWYSHYLIALGRFPESLAESKRCIELDPLDPGMIVHLGEHYIYARQYDQAIEQLLKAAEMDPSRYRIYDGLGRAYEQKRMYPQAITAFNKAVAASHDAIAQVASLAAGYAAAGQHHDAMEIVGRLKQQSSREYVPAYAIAEIYAALKDTNERFAWLEKAFQERSSALAYMKMEPRMDALRSDARFESLLQRMRLPR